VANSIVSFAGPQSVGSGTDNPGSIVITLQRYVQTTLQLKVVNKKKFTAVLLFERRKSNFVRAFHVFDLK